MPRRRTAVLAVAPTVRNDFSATVLQARPSDGAPQLVQSHLFAPAGAIVGGLSGFLSPWRWWVVAIAVAALVTLLALVDTAQQNTDPAPVLLAEDLAWTLVPLSLAFAAGRWARRRRST